jgi:hypothetical protein
MAITAYTLNYCNPDSFNLTSRTAFEGKDVAELIALGGDEADAVYGFAYGGHTDKVTTMITSNPKLSLAAAQGFARAKNTKEIEKLLTSEELKSGILFGHAQAGNEDQIRRALNSREGSRYLPVVIRGLASTGQSALLLELVSGTKYYSLALKTAAKAGHKALVELLLTQLSINLHELEGSKAPINKDISPYLKAVLEGYSEGRHFDEAIWMMELGVSAMSCLSALSPKGSPDKTDADLLISQVKNPELKDTLLKLIKRQFPLLVLNSLTEADRAELLAPLSELTTGSTSPTISV